MVLSPQIQWIPVSNLLNSRYFFPPFSLTSSSPCCKYYWFFFFLPVPRQNGMCPGSGVIWPYRSWEHRATGTAREEAAQTWPCSPSRPPNEHEECQLVGWTLRNKGSQLGFICQSPAQQVVCKGSHPGKEIVLRGGDSQTSWRSACILEVGVPMLPMEDGGWSTVPPPRVSAACPCGA